MRMDTIMDMRKIPTPAIPRMMGTSVPDVFCMNDRISVISERNTLIVRIGPRDMSNIAAVNTRRAFVIPYFIATGVYTP